VCDGKKNMGREKIWKDIGGGENLPADSQINMYMEIRELNGNITEYSCDLMEISHFTYLFYCIAPVSSKCAALLRICSFLQKWQRFSE
jgi:hypothetical protein